MSNMTHSGGVAVWSVAKFQLPIPENFLQVRVWQCGSVAGLRTTTSYRVDMSSMNLSGGVAVWSLTKCQPFMKSLIAALLLK